MDCQRLTTTGPLAVSAVEHSTLAHFSGEQLQVPEILRQAHRSHPECFFFCFGSLQNPFSVL